jgi:antitoxin component YwqK of YwqJK toxin-antitoxin module
MFTAAVLFLFSTVTARAQDTASASAGDTSKNIGFRIFHWTQKRKGEFEITVPGYDSLKTGNNDFQHFFYTASDKPDGKLTVRNEAGKKVRECMYRNSMMFDERWWFASGEKEFEGTWSETTNEYGDQVHLEFKWYYRNKKIRKHGYHTGVTTVYYNNGKTESERTFREGKADGPFREYFPDGKLQTEGEFKDGNKTGEWIHYNMDGTVQEREH